MTRTVQAPLDFSAPTKVGRRTFRKQIIRKGTIDYPMPDGTKRRVTFDDAYLDALNLAHQQGAYDDVAFILADKDNAHTMAPERFRGWVKGMERTADGIDAILELSDDAADLVERTDYRLGVSPRIKAVTHVDGRTFPVAVNHVLGTLDPRMQGPTLGLSPWEPVDLSADDDDVLDLSGATYREDRTMPRLIDLDQLAPEDRDALASYAAMQGIDLSDADVDPETPETPADDPADDPEAHPLPGEGDGLGDDDTDDDEPSDPITDDELDALIDGELEAMGLLEPLSLSTPDDGDDLDLAAPEAPAVDETAALRFKLASRDYVAAGVPPSVVDLAAPVLQLADDATLDLSTPDGAPIDVVAVVRGMLDAMKGTLDLSQEAGHGLETEPDPDTDPVHAGWVDHTSQNT